MNKPKAYIAGQISGLVYEEALRKFTEAEAIVESLGYEPINPMKKNGLDGDGNQYSWEEYMKADIPHLLACDAIALLPCWQNSRGARLEAFLATELKIRRIDLVSQALPQGSNSDRGKGDSVVTDQ